MQSPSRGKDSNLKVLEGTNAERGPGTGLESVLSSKEGGPGTGLESVLSSKEGGPGTGLESVLVKGTVG